MKTRRAKERKKKRFGEVKNRYIASSIFLSFLCFTRKPELRPACPDVRPSSCSSSVRPKAKHSWDRGPEIPVPHKAKDHRVPECTRASVCLLSETFRGVCTGNRIHKIGPAHTTKFLEVVRSVWCGEIALNVWGTHLLLGSICSHLGAVPLKIPQHR